MPDLPIDPDRDPFRRWLDDRKAATAMEYALIAAGTLIVIVGGIALIGGSLKGLFDAISTAVGGG